MRAASAVLRVATALVLGVGAVCAQTLLDRVMARVDGQTILLSDVRAASGLGVVDPDPARAVEQLIDRRLMLEEVARFPPPEPDAAAVDAEVSRLTATAGANLPALMTATGLTSDGVAALARDTLRIQAYQEQRFGAGAAISDEQARQYYEEHRDAFRRDGRVRPFEEAAEDVRREAAADRRGLLVAQWLRDLRSRAEVVVVAERPR